MDVEKEGNLCHGRPDCLFALQEGVRGVYGLIGEPAPEVVLR